MFTRLCFSVPSCCLLRFPTVPAELTRLPSPPKINHKSRLLSSGDGAALSSSVCTPALLAAHQVIIHGSVQLLSLRFNSLRHGLFFFLFFSLIFISWRLITLQYCSGFCHTLTWISHGFTCIPHPDSPSHLPLYPIPLGLPNAPGPSTCLTWTFLFKLESLKEALSPQSGCHERARKKDQAFSRTEQLKTDPLNLRLTATIRSEVYFLRKDRANTNL